MVKKNRLILFLTAISLMVTLCLVVTTASGDGFTPPPPDKSKALPANDGGPDGCDSSRFKCVMNGAAVLDKQTGLVWAKDYTVFKKVFPWEEAVKSCQNIEIDGQKGWRLPTRDELITLLDTSQSRPALPEGHPFTKMNDRPQGGGGNAIHWTSNDYKDNSDNAWYVNVGSGKVNDSNKLFDYRVWPVRDGE